MTSPDTLASTAPPLGLSEPALPYWTYYARILKKRQLWTESTRDSLRNYCDQLVLRDRIQGELDEVNPATGKPTPLAFIVTKTDSDGNERDDIKPHPHLAQIRAIHMVCRQYANDLCLPPAAAIRMPARADGDGDEVDDWGGTSKGKRTILRAAG